MNMFQAMNVINDPQGYVTQQAMQQAMQQMIREHPNEWQATREKFGNMSRRDMVKALRKEYRRQGQDLDAVAARYGVQLS